MSDLLTEDLKGRTVVSVGGDDLAVVDGLVRDGDDVLALQLVKTGLFGGSMDEVLPVGAIVGIGPDAVVVGASDVLVEPDLLAGSGATTPGDIVAEEAPTLDDDPRRDGDLLFTEARHRDVVSTEDEDCVGRVDRFVVHPTEQRVWSIRLDNVDDMRRYLSWRDVDAFADEVTVSSARVLRLPDGPREERVRRDYGMLARPVLTDTGHALERITDVAFDPATGALTALLLEDGSVLDGQRVRGVGPHAVVVAH